MVICNICGVDVPGDKKDLHKIYHILMDIEADLCGISKSLNTIAGRKP